MFCNFGIVTIIEVIAIIAAINNIICLAVDGGNLVTTMFLGSFFKKSKENSAQENDISDTEPDL